MRQSFIINILHQQNSSWQGTITWLNEDKTQNFRSALELIRLIDSTLDGEMILDWKEASDQVSEL